MEQKKLLVTDTTMRDAHQSLLSTRMRTRDMVKGAEGTADFLADCFSLEMWGGATFDTALLDAAGGAIHHIGNIHNYARPQDVPEHTLFVITTDGMENASRRYSAQKVKEMIQRQKEKYGWEFLFLGANIDAVETAGYLGIAPDRAVNYHCDSVGTRLNYEVVGQAVAAVRCSAPPGRALEGRHRGGLPQAAEEGAVVIGGQNERGTEAAPPSLVSVSEQISRSFQLGAVPEGVAHLLAQHPVGVVDGVEGDGPQLVRVDLPVSAQNGLVGAHVDDLAHQTAALRVVAHQAALHRHGQRIEEERVHKLRPGGVPAGPGHLVRQPCCRTRCPHSRRPPVCSAVAMLTVKALRARTLAVVLWSALMHMLSSLSSLMPPQAAFMASRVPSSL